MSDEEIRHFSAILENVLGQVRLVAEGNVALRADFQAMARNFGLLNGTVDRIADDVAVLKTDVAVLKTDVAKLDGRVHRIEDHLGLNGSTKGPKRAARRSAR